MATKVSEPKVDLIKARAEGLALLEPIDRWLRDFTVESEEDYLEADTKLSNVLRAEKAWDERITPPIEHIRTGLDMLYSLRNDIAIPLKKAKEQIKGLMKEFKLQEMKKLQAIEEAKQKEIKRLEAEALNREQAIEKAKSQPYKDKLIEQRAAAEQQAENLKASGPAQGVKGMASPRKVKKWRVDDLAAFLAYVIEHENDDLMSLVQIDEVQMNACFRIESPAVGKWLPGIVVYEDIDIAGRSR